MNLDREMKKKICKLCGKPLKWGHIYCSAKCSANDPERKEKLRKRNKRLGIVPPHFRGKKSSHYKGAGRIFRCSYCGKRFKALKISKRKFCSYQCYWKSKVGQKQSIKTRKKRSDIQKRRYQKDSQLGKRLRKERSRIAKKLWQNEEYRNKVIKNSLKTHFKRPNNVEFILNKILKTNFPKEWKYVGNGRVIIEKKNPDFININGKKLIIELFGSYWHKKSEVSLRKKLFAKYGYKTLVLWDYELKNESRILEKVRGLYAGES